MSSYNNKNYLNIFIFILYDKEILFSGKKYFRKRIFSLSFLSRADGDAEQGSEVQ